MNIRRQHRRDRLKLQEHRARLPRGSIIRLIYRLPPAYIDRSTRREMVDAINASVWRIGKASMGGKSRKSPHFVGQGLHTTVALS